MDHNTNSCDKNTLPWIEKYRPMSLNDVASHKQLINTLKLFIKNKCLPHLLFYGPPGTGKTSIAMACAREIYGKYINVMVMELNASDDRGIEVVRNKIKQFVSSSCTFYGKTPKDRENMFKLVILDETDAMTNDAQAILRKVVEEYTTNTRFCLICNYIEKVIPALQSRCTRFRFAPLNNVDVKKKIVQICKLENITITKTGIQTIIKRSKGDMRKVLNILQSTNMIYDKINGKNVNTCIGYPQKSQIKAVFNSLISDPFDTCYRKILNLSFGLSIKEIIKEIHDILVDQIINKQDDMDLTIENIIFILDKMRNIEYNLSTNSFNEIQISGLIGVFKLTI